MLLTREWFLSTWTLFGLFHFGRRMPSVGSLECAHCGLVIVARSEVGTSSFTCAIDLHQPKQSRSKHVLVATHEGRLSISCALSASDERR